MDYLQPEEVGRLLEACPPQRRLLFKTAILTGIRIGELLAMKWDHLDWCSGRYHVVESLWRGRGGWQLVSPKTEISRRSIKLPAGLIVEFREHRAAQLKDVQNVGDEYENHGFIFCQANGRPLDAGNLLNRDFRRALNRAGLRRIRIHDLRHTFAALMIAQGEHPKTIQDAMGHSSITVTMNTYGHLLPRLQEQAADRLETSLFAGSTASQPAEPRNK